MRTNNKKGISLIVLVITIIVMIILAAAIILSLDNSGIIDKANKAKKDSDTANLKEYVSILEAEYELMTETERAGKTSTQYVNDKLAEKYPKAALSADGEVYANLTENARKAVVAGIKIGDEVKGYNAYLTQNASYTTDGKENRYYEEHEDMDEIPEPDKTPQTISVKNDYIWKYMGISGNGDLQIVACAINEVAEASKISLGGKGGYLYGVDALNSACSRIYSTSKGTARSINIDDVIDLLDFTGDRCRFNYMTEKTYEGSEETYMDDDTDFLHDPISLDELSKLHPSDSQDFVANACATRPDYIKGSDLAIDFSFASTSEDINNKEYVDLVFNHGSYFIASTSLFVDGNLFRAGMYVTIPGIFMCSGSVVGTKEFHDIVAYVNNCMYMGDKLPLKPIVTLNSDVTITKDASAENTWNI